MITEQDFCSLDLSHRGGAGSGQRSQILFFGR
jgi:hypothetical protein